MSPRLKSLLKILSDGYPHLEEELAQQLDITPAKIQRYVHELKCYDVPIETTSSAGYVIPGGMELLDQHKIYQLLPSKHTLSPRQISVFDILDSTNNWLKNFIPESNLEESWWCLAEQQTSGRGRTNREWLSPFGCNLYLSGLCFTQQRARNLGGLSLVLAIAIIEALKACGVEEELQLKWPNDIYFQQSKLAGILVEIYSRQVDFQKKAQERASLNLSQKNDAILINSRPEYQHHAAIIMGVGINIRMPEKYRVQLSQSWINVSDLKNQKNISRNQLAAQIIFHWLNAVKVFETQGFSAFYQTFRAYDLSLGKQVQIVLPQNEIVTGISESIDEQGYFQLRNPHGKLQRFACGEVSLKIT